MDKRDTRGILEIDPKVELKDYSGPFKPDLRFTDFSREQLAKCYLMACEYFYDTIEAWANHVAEKFGMEAMVEAQDDIWRKKMVGPAQEIIKKWMNIKGGDIESMMKGLQMDSVWGPVKFDVVFDLPSKDHGMLITNRCPVVDQFEALGLPDILKDFCKACYETIEVNAKNYHPDIVTTCLAIPPRKSKDDICCKIEFTYKSK